MHFPTQFSESYHIASDICGIQTTDIESWKTSDEKGTLSGAFVLQVFWICGAGLLVYTLRSMWDVRRNATFVTHPVDSIYHRFQAASV
jgi:uncharacterized BrkB/YihY/UPF0761 family membrane protein